MSYSDRPVAGRGVEIKDSLSEYLVVDRPVKVIRPNKRWNDEPPKQQERIIFQ